MPQDPNSRPIDIGTLVAVAGAAITLLGSFVRIYKIGDIGWSVWTINAAPGLFGVGTWIPGFAAVAALAAVLRSFGGLGERRVAGFDLMQLQVVAAAFATLQWLGFAVSIVANRGSDLSPDFDPGLGLLLMFVGLAAVVGGTVLSGLGGQIPGLGAKAGDPTVTTWPGTTPEGSGQAAAYPPPGPSPVQPAPSSEQWPAGSQAPAASGPFPVPDGQSSGGWPQQAPAQPPPAQPQPGWQQQPAQPQPDWQQPPAHQPPAQPEWQQPPAQPPPAQPQPGWQQPGPAAPSGPPPPPRGGPIDPGTQVIPGPPPAPPEDPPAT